MTSAKGEISVSNAHPNYRIPRKPVIRGVKNILQKEKIPRAKSLNIIFSDNRNLKKLNQRFRRKAKATDVLSFPFHEPDFLGEVYISLEKTAAQAKQYKHRFFEELSGLISHGLLHLCGYEHGDDRSCQKMMAKQRLYAAAFPFYSVKHS